MQKNISIIYLLSISIFLSFLGCSKDEEKVGIDQTVGTHSVYDGLSGFPVTLFTDHAIIVSTDTVDEDKLKTYYPMSVTISKASASTINLIVKYNVTTDNKTLFELNNVSFIEASNSGDIIKYNIILTDESAFKNIKFNYKETAILSDDKLENNGIYSISHVEGTITSYGTIAPNIDFSLYIKLKDGTEKEVFRIYSSSAA